MVEAFVMRHAKAKRLPFLTNEDLGLSEVGKREVEKFVSGVELSFHLVYASPLRRARETAESISKELEVSLVLDERLVEYSFGDCEGLSYEELSSNLGIDEEEGLFFAKEALGMHGHTTYERYESVVDRVKGFFSEVEESSLVVTHGEVIRTMMSEAEGGPEPLLKRREVGNCALFRVVFEGKKFLKVEPWPRL